MLLFPYFRISLGLWLFRWNQGCRRDEAATPGYGVCQVTLGAVNSLVELHFAGVFRASLRPI